MPASSESVIFITDEPPHRPRISIGQGMIAVAGSAVVFALFGVNQAAGIVIGAFFVSAWITRPEVWQGWVLLSMAALAALPFILIAAMYTFAFRAALFLRHWPTYNTYPKNLSDHFHRASKYLDFVIPTLVSVAVTYLFFTLVMRFATWPRRLEFGLAAASLLWLFAFVLICGDPFRVGEWILD
jgi:MFS family permease